VLEKMLVRSAKSRRSAHSWLVSPALRNVLVFTGCLLVLGVAGGLATLALRSSTVAGTQIATAPVVVDTNDEAGAAKLTVLAPVRFSSGAGQREVAAGTQFTTASALLASALDPPSIARVGTTLTCDLRIGVSSGEPVIDLVRCARARTSPRG
jgi:hypothetical protein